MSKIIAAYGGGFKPPTAGHFEVVKKALDTYPEIDEFIIYVGSKVRNGLGQSESILIWDIFKKYLPMKVKIEPAKSPIGDIIRLGKNNPDDKVYFIIGGREGRQDDLDDINSRTKNIEQAYPNMEVKIQTTLDKGMSGTNAREAAKISSDELNKYLPDELTDIEKKEVFDIIRPVVNEIKLPNITDLKSKFKTFLDKLKQEGKETKDAFNLLVQAAKGDKKLTDLDKQQIKEQLKDILKGVFGVTVFALPAGSLVLILLKLIKMQGIITPSSFLNENNEVDELESLLNKWSAYSGQYDLLPDIAELAKNLGVNNGPSIVYRAVPGLDEYPYTKQEVIDYDKEQEIVATTPTRKQAEYFITDNADWAYILEYEPHIVINFDEFEEKYGWSGNWGEGEILIDVTKSKLVNIEDYTKKQNINENASYTKDINLIERLAQLTQHMLDKGMNIEPLPNLEFVDGDSENAREFLGKTAYYDPNTQTIVLYTEGRHPKDIARSYTHEMIHHTQNLEGRLGDIQTTNTQEDDHLNDIEAEANLKGTMTFRNWTDSLNEAVTAPKTEKKKINISFELFDGTKVDEDVILAFSPNSTGIFTLGDNIEKYTGLSKKEAEEYNETTTDAYIYGLVNTMNDGQDIFFFNNGTRLKGQASKLGDSAAVIEQIAHEGLHLTRLIIAKTLMGDKFPTGEWPSVGEQDNDSIEEEQLTTALSYVLNKITKPFLEMASNYIPKLSLNEAIVGEKIECDNCGWSWNIVDGGDDLFICHKCGHDNSPLNEAKPYNHKHGFNDKLGKDPFGLNQFAREVAEGVLNEGRYDALANKLSSIAFGIFKDIHDRGDKEGEFEFRVDHPDEEHDIPSKEFYFDFVGKVEITDGEYNVDGGANAGFDKNGDPITPLLSVNFKIPKNPKWSTISMDLKDVVRHELEHLTQDGDNEKGGVISDDPKLARPSKYMKDDQLVRDLIDSDMLSKSQYFKLEKEVDAMLQGLYFKAKKSKRPFKDVIDDYLNIFINQKTITQKEKEDILNIWRSRNKALSLPIFENELGMDYKIFSDMDGVLTDFDGSFVKYSKGIQPRDYEKKFGKDGFWELIDGEGGVGFWAGMPWMEDGKEYWNYIKDYNTELLSSPSRSETSRLGKRLWVKNNMPGVKLTLAQAYNKKNYAEPNHILIDDRKSNIEQWREAGGIGILHTSASDTIKQLKALGL